MLKNSVRNSIPWYKKALDKNRREIISGTIFATASALAFLLWRYALGKTFVWTNIEPISTPFWYSFYSALVFVGPGAYLYYFTDFYKDLWHFFRDVLDAPGLHRDVKAVIWLSMVIAMFAVVAVVVYILNTIISFFYNVFGLILYLCPPLGAGFIVAAISYLFLKSKKGSAILSIK